MEICGHYEQGLPVGEIARAFSVSEGTVSRVAYQAGAEPRRRHPGRALENAAFDPTKLTGELVDGEWRVRDVVLGEALGYERPRALRQLIERLMPQLLALGKAPQRVAPSHVGRGAQPVTETLLSLKQVNYLITRCGLPRADEWCKQIALVFTGWQTGTLSEPETIIEIERARASAEEAAPALADMSAEAIMAELREVKAKVDTVDYKVDRQGVMIAAFVRRRAPSAETKRQHKAAVIHYFSGRCPCCSDRAVVTPTGEITGHFDHWTDHPYKNGPHETWLICAECNTGFQSRRIDRQDYRAEFDVFQKRRKQWVETHQPALL